MECDDFIFDPTLTEIHTFAAVSAEERYTAFQGMEQSTITHSFELIHVCADSKKKRETYKPWKPDHKDTNALQGAEPIPCHGEFQLRCR